MEPGQWLLDSCVLDAATGRSTNLTAIERVSHYNGGLFFLPGRRHSGVRSGSLTFWREI
jgi:TolB protein